MATYTTIGSFLSDFMTEISTDLSATFDRVIRGEADFVNGPFPLLVVDMRHFAPVQRRGGGTQYEVSIHLRIIQLVGVPATGPSLTMADLIGAIEDWIDSGFSMLAGATGMQGGVWSISSEEGNRAGAIVMGDCEKVAQVMVEDTNHV